MTALHQKAHLDDDDRRALRAHHARYGVDAMKRARLAKLRVALEEMRESTERAIVDRCGVAPHSAAGSVDDVLTGLKFLVEGNGRFR